MTFSFVQDENERNGVNAAPINAVPQTSLAALLAKCFTKTPEAPALSFGNTTLSYAEIDARTAALANELRTRGVGPETIVAICLPRSIDLILAIVATIRAGGAYVPLNPEDPKARRTDIMAECRPVVLLAEEACGPTPVLAPIDWPEDGICPDATDLRPDNLALVLFTSGSTGKPKGVLLDHGAVVNSLFFAIGQLGFEPGEKFLHKSPMSFDISVWEVFVPLLSGGEVVIRVRSWI